MTKILKISDGTTTIDFLDETGFWCSSWRPSIVQYKDGGVWSDSKLSPGRRLVYRVFTNAVETFNLAVVGTSQDAVAVKIQNLLRLLERAADYWTSGSQNAPVYIIAKSDDETNTRYAIVYKGELSGLADPNWGVFDHGIHHIVNYPSGMSELLLSVERGHWLDAVPGTGTCVQTDTRRDLYWMSEVTTISTDPTTIGRSIVEKVSNGNLYTVDSDDVLKSTNGGVGWSVSDTFGGSYAYECLVLANGYILAIGQNASNQGQVRRTTSDGSSWSTVDTVTACDWGRCMVQLSNGYVLAFHRSATTGKIRRSTNNGDSWSDVYTGPMQPERAIQTDTGRVICTESSQNCLLISDDNGATWTKTFPFTGVASYGIWQHPVTDRIFAGLTGPKLMYSDDDGDTWDENFTFKQLDVYWDNVEAHQFAMDGFGFIWCAADGILAISKDDGDTWMRYTAVGFVSDCFSVLALDDGNILTREDGDVCKITLNTDDYPITIGHSATCEQVFVGNRTSETFTNVLLQDDGGVVSSNLYPVTLPYTMYPSSPATDDAMVFGTDMFLEFPGRTCVLVFDIATAQEGATIVWEKHAGFDDWNPLSVVDNTNQFLNTGINTVSWNGADAGIADTNYEGVAYGWLIRARISGGTMTTRPVIQNVQLHTVSRASVLIDDQQAGGDLSPLARIRVYNCSDKDGRGGSEPDHWFNRMVIGLRSESRGQLFNAYLNLSNRQPIPGVNIWDDPITVGSQIYDYQYTPSYGTMVWTAGASQTDFLDICRFEIAPEVSGNYYGTFHAYARGHQNGGASGDLDARLVVRSGSGGIESASLHDYFKTTGSAYIYEVLDFGQIKLPASDILRTGELPEQTVIAIQGRNNSATTGRSMTIVDIILIPVDEWAGDFRDSQNVANSVVGTVNGVKRYIDIDSVRYTGSSIRALVKTDVAADSLAAIYQSISSREAFLQSNADQRLWFFFLQSSAVGTSYHWRANPWITAGIKVTKTSRYLSMRGNR